MVEATLTQNETFWKLFPETVLWLERILLGAT